MKPLEDKLVVRVHPEEKKTAGGIHLANTKPSMVTEGTVTAVGPGKTSSVNGLLRPLACKVGNVVIYNKHAAQIIDKEHIIVSEAEVIAIRL